MNCLYTVTLILLLLLTALFTTLLGITAHLFAWTSQHASQTFIWSDTTTNDSYNFHYIPKNNRDRSYILLLTTGCLCTIFNLSSFFALGTLRPFKLAIRNRHVPFKITTKPILVACTTFSVFLTVAALALSFTDFALNPPLLPCAGQWQDCSDQPSRTTNPSFTLEGWVCPIAQQSMYTSNTKGLVIAQLNGICTETKVVRWWTVALLVVELSVMFCGFLMVRDHGTSIHGARFETVVLGWDNNAAQGSQLGTHEHEDAAPRYGDQIPTLSEQNGQLFKPLDQVNDDYRKPGFVASSQVSPIRDEKRGAPAYEPVGNHTVREAESRERHVHDADEISEHPSELPASRVTVISELPAEKPVR